MQRALLAGIIVSIAAGMVGVFVVLRGLAFMGDAVAHTQLGRRGGRVGVGRQRRSDHAGRRGCRRAHGAWGSATHASRTASRRHGNWDHVRRVLCARRDVDFSRADLRGGSRFAIGRTHPGRFVDRPDRDGSADDRRDSPGAGVFARATIYCLRPGSGIGLRCSGHIHADWPAGLDRAGDGRGLPTGRRHPRCRDAGDACGRSGPADPSVIDHDVDGDHGRHRVYRGRAVRVVSSRPGGRAFDRADRGDPDGCFVHPQPSGLTRDDAIV